ncbi:hypothetical protein NARC_90113 [Candidatus Nitrosocosmicus arcticus]|uniref:Uncharacterized protein n=1 Tax=Candidatus Nitrosocosmicus arcticus TaxID=2035267 RepID=A0A557SUC2_9ARCH|nr:hypothetical protein NARC_90113 [Candidatus Nitrosocosmicus arcticus]
MQFYIIKVTIFPALNNYSSESIALRESYSLGFRDLGLSFILHRG